MEATILHPLPMVAGRGSSTNFKAIHLYLWETMKTNENATNAEI
jgi:hypothetical protein